MLLVTLLHAALAAVGIALVYRHGRADRSAASSRGGWADLVLFNAFGVAMILHSGIRPFPHPTILVHEHDIFHYYMGSKYSAEVGYFDLYYCAAVADEENGDGPGRSYSIRKLDDYRTVASATILDRAESYRGLFSESRWQRFRADVATFHAAMGESRWRHLFMDNGYNATPVWSTIAGRITNLVSVQSRLGLPLLAFFDHLLIALMFVVLGRTFSWRTALLAGVFFGSLFPMAPAFIRGALLRLDWLAFAVMSICALKVGRHKTAGALLAYAGLVRMFPLVLLFGPGARLAWGLWTARRLDRRLVGFFATGALSAGALVALSAVAGDGLDAWHAFFEKIRFHDTNMSVLRVGFKPLLLAGAATVLPDWPTFATGRALQFGEVREVWWVVQALVLGASFFAVRRLEDYESVAYGWVLIYFLAAPTFYYQVALVLLTLLFLPRLEQGWRRHAMALLFGSSLVGYVIWTERNLGQGVVAAWHSASWTRFDYAICLTYSAMLLLIALYVIGNGVGRYGGPYGVRPRGGA